MQTCLHREWQTHKQHLECMWGVMDAVDTEAVVQGEAGRSGGKQSQLQAFAGRLWRAGLAHQAVCSQLLHENMTTLLLQLQVARRRQSLLSYCQHLLQKRSKFNDATSADKMTIVWYWSDAVSPPKPPGVSVS